MPKSVFEGDVEKATSEYNVQEDWQIIMDITDRVKSLPNGPKDSLKSIMKRITNPIPHVSMQALTLLAACVENCGKPFHLEICSREWTNEARSIITRGHDKVSEKLRELVEKWADEFKDDPQLHLMVKFYKQLKADGFSFDSATASSSGPATKSKSAKSNDDELNFKEDLDLAIAMSLQESEAGGSKGPPSSAPSSSLYPSNITSSSAVPTYAGEPEIFQVRALYDFEAAEDNEMTFKTGEVFSVLDNSDENWWKGRNNAGIGLFPANFVTTQLVEENSAEKKKVRFADEETMESNRKNATSVNKEPNRSKVVISEESLDLTLHMLKNASPVELDDEEESIIEMEEKSQQMGTLIEKKILHCDNKKDDLNELNEKFLEALNIYQQLMKEPLNAPPPPIATPQLPAGYPAGLQQYQQQAYIQPGYPSSIGYDPRLGLQQPPVYDASYMNPSGIVPPDANLPAANYDPNQIYAHQIQQATLPSYDNSTYELAPPSYAYDEYSQQNYSQGQYYGADSSYMYQQANNYGYGQQPPQQVQQQHTSVYQ